MPFKKVCMAASGSDKVHLLSGVPDEPARGMLSNTM